MNAIKNSKKINFALSFIYACLIVFFITHLPVIFISVLALLCVWNFYLTLSNKPKPNAWLANVLAGSILILMLYSLDMGDTITLFVAMLLLSSLFKLLQAKKKKHYHVIITLTFFSLSAVYLFNQSILATILVSGLYILNFAVLGLLESKHSLKLASKQSGKLLLVALPLAIFLLLFLPRIPAFWQLQGPKLAQTGLSEHVDPFNIAKLANSDELVFRAKFNDPAPTPPHYWRAIVHDQFNGNAWLRSDLLKYFNVAAANTQPVSQSINYSVIAEPANQKWLYGLGFANSDDTSVESNALGLLSKSSNQAKSLHYSVHSLPLSASPLLAWQKTEYIRIPKNNSKALQLSAELKNRTHSDRAFYDALLAYFATHNFSYTLTPEPMTGSNTIDQFLFDKQRGFCGHYASAAAYLFRSAGIPATVVSGYLGGELNQESNYLSVRQYDAHAWVEVYLQEEGWQVFDATAVVAPERLTGSLSQNEQLNDEFNRNLNFGLISLSSFTAINWLRVQLDHLDYQWSSWVLGFDKQKQSHFLKSIFGDKNLWLVPLTVVTILGLSFISYFAYLNWPKRAAKLPPLVSEYNQLLRWAKKQQIIGPAHYTPAQQLSYIAEQAPQIAQPLNEFSVLFKKVRYSNKPFTKEHKNQAKDLIKLIKISKQRRL
jgi:protein-glutamine gamma-glutamyltransferase